MAGFDSGEGADNRVGLVVLSAPELKSGEGPAMRFVTGFGILGALAVLTSPVVAAANDMRGVFVGSGASKFAEIAQYPPATLGVQGSFRYQARLYARYALARNPNAKFAVMSRNDGYGRDDLSGPKDVPGEKYDALVTDVGCEVLDPTIDSEIVKPKASGADVPVIAVTDLTCSATFLAQHLPEQDLLEKQELLEKIARSSC
jgi:hypothetical protein